MGAALFSLDLNRAEHGAFGPPFTLAVLFFMHNRSLFIRGVLLGLYLLLLHD
jgi:hypothetical protein